MVFTRHSAGKIWSSIYIPDNLYSRYCISYIIRLIRCDESDSFPYQIYPICKSHENDCFYDQNTEAH